MEFATAYKILCFYATDLQASQIELIEVQTRSSM